MTNSSDKKGFAIVAAVDKKMGIGIKNRLPWPRLEGDMTFFSNTTSSAPEGKMNAVIMGRKTWESLPESSRPLKDRLNIVLSRKGVEVPEGVEVVTSLDTALNLARGREDIHGIFVIGGAQIYKEAIEREDCHQLKMTEVLAEFECDAFFPDVDWEKWKPVSHTANKKEHDIEYRHIMIGRIDGCACAIHNLGA